MTYSRMLDAHYHRRMYVSLPSSEWDRVVPYSYCHQGEGGGSRAGELAFYAHTLSLVASERTCMQVRLWRINKDVANFCFEHRRVVESKAT